MDKEELKIELHKFLKHIREEYTDEYGMLQITSGKSDIVSSPIAIIDDYVDRIKVIPKTINVEISRCLHDGGWKPYYLTCRDYRVKKDWDEFKTLKDLKVYYNIDKLTKKGKGWAINSRGKKIEWDEYVGEISTEYIIK